MRNIPTNEWMGALNKKKELIGKGSLSFVRGPLPRIGGFGEAFPYQNNVAKTFLGQN